MNYMAMGDANEDEMNAMLEEVGELQERLDSPTSIFSMRKSMK